MPDNCTPAEATRLVADVRAYMQRHRLKMPDMADHAGISRHTLKYIIAGTRQPRQEARAALMAAVGKPPPARPEPPHADVVRELWGRASSEQIGQKVGVSGARIRAIAKAIGLTGDRAAA